MLVKIYGMLWAVLAAIALLLLVTGNLTMLAVVALGFVCFGMIFMGMMGVLPSTVGHNAAPAAPKPPKAAKPAAVREEQPAFQAKHLATR